MFSNQHISRRKTTASFYRAEHSHNAQAEAIAVGVLEERSAITKDVSATTVVMTTMNRSRAERHWSYEAWVALWIWCPIYKKGTSRLSIYYCPPILPPDYDSATLSFNDVL